MKKEGLSECCFWKNGPEKTPLLPKKPKRKVRGVRQDQATTFLTIKWLKRKIGTAYFPLGKAVKRLSHT